MIRSSMYAKRLFSMFLVAFMFLSAEANAQSSLTLNLAPIDGMALTPGNIFDFQVLSSFPGAVNAQVNGTIHYRNSPLSISYSFNCSIKPGMNMLGNASVHPQWQFSSSALKELFFNYKVMPDGTFEYCVTITPVNQGSGDASANGAAEECLYHRAGELFILNLVDPENNIKLHEYNPMLSWTANCSFASQLNYRLRVAPVLKGQNAENAIARNNPVFDERNLIQNSLVYPIYAKPLEKNQYYAWTVDAYYKGILLGGSEIWQFIIVEDSLFSNGFIPSSYIDITREQGKTGLYAPGQLKLKYVLNEARTDTLSLQLFNENDGQVNLKAADAKLNAVYGDNRYEIKLKENYNLRHEGKYKLLIKTKRGTNYSLPFEYVNPDFIH